MNLETRPAKKLAMAFHAPSLSQIIEHCRLAQRICKEQAKDSTLPLSERRALISDADYFAMAAYWLDAINPPA